MAFPSSAFSDITARYRNSTGVALHPRNSADHGSRKVDASAAASLSR